MTFDQFERLRSYLDRDAREHVAAHGKWGLDGGKLLAALEEAGVPVSDDPDPALDSVLTDARYAARQIQLYQDHRRALDAVERIVETCERLSRS